MPPRDAYEWLRVLKLQRQLRTEAADRISRAQALDLLVERARVLRQTMMAIPRRMRHLLNDEVAGAVTREIRAALAVYAAPKTATARDQGPSCESIAQRAASGVCF